MLGCRRKEEGDIQPGRRFSLQGKALLAGRVRRNRGKERKKKDSGGSTTTKRKKGGAGT